MSIFNVPAVYYRIEEIYAYPVCSTYLTKSKSMEEKIYGDAFEHLRQPFWERDSLVLGNLIDIQ